MKLPRTHAVVAGLTLAVFTMAISGNAGHSMNADVAGSSFWNNLSVSNVWNMITGATPDSAPQTPTIDPIRGIERGSPPPFYGNTGRGNGEGNEFGGEDRGGGIKDCGPIFDSLKGCPGGIDVCKEKLSQCDGADEEKRCAVICGNSGGGGSGSGENGEGGGRPDKCGDGTCNVEIGENRFTCPDDCGNSGGDGSGTGENGDGGDDRWRGAGGNNENTVAGAPAETQSAGHPTPCSAPTHTAAPMTLPKGWTPPWMQPN